MSSLHVTIPDTLHHSLQAEVAAGRYASEADAVSAALELLLAQDEEQKLAELRALIQEGLDSGEAVPLDMEAIIARARAKHFSS